MSSLVILTAAPRRRALLGACLSVACLVVACLVVACLVVACLVVASLGVSAAAQTSLPAAIAPAAAAIKLPTIRVAAPRAKPQPSSARSNATATAVPSGTPPSYDTGAPNVAGGAPIQPTMASQITISGHDLNARPIVRPGDILEAAPGLAVVMHADGGKANQYYLRGYNLDHGTDLAIFVDDMPINLPTHVHGQGYADLNWLMPETVNGLNIRKGPYFADVGDFATAGSLFINLRDSVEKKILQASTGSFGYQRAFTMGSIGLGGGTLLYAGEVNTYNGPWATPDNVRKLSGELRFSQGTPTDGFSVTGLAYSNKWTSSDQIPLRAIQSGQVGLYGELDPTDGGNSNRFLLSARMAQSDADGFWKANAYLEQIPVDFTRSLRA
jgi:hypothetical protein